MENAKEMILADALEVAIKSERKLSRYRKGVACLLAIIGGLLVWIGRS